MTASRSTEGLTTDLVCLEIVLRFLNWNGSRLDRRELSSSRNLKKRFLFSSEEFIHAL